MIHSATDEPAQGEVLAPKFSPGQLVATPGALEKVQPEEMQAALARHLRGDWGEIGKDDRRENDLSLEKGFRLVSVYRTAAGLKFWIITEHDRSVTTILLPDEY
ncbi:MAG: hypothetical protein K8R23_01275 [Chthoniobacter sp.]|nr:hypothetical protein [Chthoniobacter sp.]